MLASIVPRSPYPDLNALGIGMASLPLSLLASELFTQIAKQCHFTTITSSQFLKDGYPCIHIDDKKKTIQTNAERIQSFVLSQSTLLISMASFAVLHEGFYRTFGQYLVLTNLTHALNLDTNALPAKIARVLIISALCTYRSFQSLEATEQFYPFQPSKEKLGTQAYRQEKQIHKKQIAKIRNCHIIEIVARSIISGALYEYTQHNLISACASLFAHIYFVQSIREKFWNYY